jgi:hypothetical protein
MTKTIVIYNTFGAENIKFIVVDRDVSHLDGKYINMNASDEEADEINDILFYPKGHDRAWEYRDYIFLDSFPVGEVDKDTKVINFGFPP